MNKLKRAITIILAALILVFMSVGMVVPIIASADSAEENVQTNIVDPDISADESLNDGFVAQFTEYLKVKYGDDYEFYYNQIIEQWGSVEAYLLSLGDKLPEEYQSDWDKFVNWLGEYSVIWAPVLAVILVILVGVIGKKQFNKIVERVVNSKLRPIVRELNSQDNATVAIIHAQKALLGTNEKFAPQLKELEDCEKELVGNE